MNDLSRAGDENNMCNTGSGFGVMFMGTAGYIPDRDNDTCSMLLNRRYLVDTGWCAVQNLMNCGIDPLQVSCLFFTHFHHDHYLSLPSFLFYLLCKGKKLDDLQIIGPAGDIGIVVKAACDFLQVERFYKDAGFPVITALNAGDVLKIDELDVSVCPTMHPVRGLCYRFEDAGTGRSLSITGDTAYYPPLIEHVRHSSLLIHEVSMGPAAVAEAKMKPMHSDAGDAGRTASLADVGRLFLVHGNKSMSEKYLTKVSEYFHKEVIWPENGVEYNI